ncbi:MAG: DsbA family oxidoreductase [Betaproteobacteria bacterium]|nr:MAG: DsbA family oxidoreductase [Betaproteobacteria bacterium]
MANTSKKTLSIDVVSDVVCPWCYIGKRHLEAALATWRASSPLAETTDVHVRWHPFQLNPDLPAEGVDRQGYLENKFGGKARAAEIYARVGAAGRSAGLVLNFDGIARQPNTLAAHALIAFVQQHQPDRADALVERLFQAYFIDGRFIGDVDVLVAIASECGLDAASVRAAISDPWTLEKISAQDQTVRSQGVTGVPFFVFNNQTALSGAQPPELIARAMSEALQRPVTPV